MRVSVRISLAVSLVLFTLGAGLAAAEHAGPSPSRCRGFSEAGAVMAASAEGAVAPSEAAHGVANVYRAPL
jgi:hypothetical protein